MATILGFPPQTFKGTRAAVEARLAEARAARGRAYTAEARDHAIVEYLAKNEELKKLDTEYLDALRDLLELDVQESTNG